MTKMQLPVTGRQFTSPNGHAEGGYKRNCPQCGAEHFPRTDPVVIMLPIFIPPIVAPPAALSTGIFISFIR